MPFASFDIAIEPLLKNEGVFANDKYDKGGKTRYGVTEMNMRLDGYWGKPEEFPLDWAIKIFKKKYWDKLSLSLFGDQGLANDIFDAGINMGTGTVGKFVQQAVNVLNRNQRSWLDLFLDGLVGPKTAATINILGTEDMAFLKIGIAFLRGNGYWEIANGKDQEMNIRSWFRRIVTPDLIEAMRKLLAGK